MDAGVRKGFIIMKVNGEEVHSLSEFENAFNAATKSPEQVLFMSGMFQSGKRSNYAVDLSDGSNATNNNNDNSTGKNKPRSHRR